MQRAGVDEWSLEQEEVKCERLKGLALEWVSLKIFINGLEKQEERPEDEIYPGGIKLFRVLLVNERRKDKDERRKNI